MVESKSQKITKINNEMYFLNNLKTIVLDGTKPYEILYLIEKDLTLSYIQTRRLFNNIIYHNVPIPKNYKFYQDLLSSNPLSPLRFEIMDGIKFPARKINVEGLLNQIHERLNRLNESIIYLKGKGV